MIIDQYVMINVCSKYAAYWKNKGYSVSGQEFICIKVFDLQPKSNVRVKCFCVRCNRVYDNRFSRVKPICYPCQKSVSMKGNKLGKGHSKGKSHFGPSHPRWNPNKTAFREYSNRVRWLTEKNYIEHINIINPENLPRTICGTNGGYQLDHKISIKHGFENKIEEAKIATVENLEMIPWQVNRYKAYK